MDFRSLRIAENGETHTVIFVVQVCSVRRDVVTGKRAVFIGCQWLGGMLYPGMACSSVQACAAVSNNTGEGLLKLSTHDTVPRGQMAAHHTHPSIYLSYFVLPPT